MMNKEGRRHSSPCLASAGEAVPHSLNMMYERRLPPISYVPLLERHELHEPQAITLQSLTADIQAHTRQRLPQYTTELQELCSIDTHSTYKPGLDETAMILAARMRGLDMDVTTFKHEQWGNDLLGVLRGTGSGTIVLLGHTDTIYSVGTAAAHPMRVEDDIAYGPGVANMKGGILSAIYAIEGLLAINYRAFGEIRLLCVSDAELPQRHSLDLFRTVLQKSDSALVLEPARTNGNLVSARKGWTLYTLSARRQSTSSSEKGHKAIIELAHQVLQFQSLHGWREGLTINPGVISGGTVGPDSAEVSLDLRFFHSPDRTATEQQWREMMQNQLVPDIELTLEAASNSREPMVRTPKSMKLVQLAQEIASDLEFPLGQEISGASSDANYAAQHGIPVLDGLGPIGGLYNGPDEYLRLDSVPSRTALLAGLIMSMEE